MRAANLWIWKNIGGHEQEASAGADGNLMLCEGVEMLDDRANLELIRNPFMQAVEFRGGKGAKICDYCHGSVANAPAERKPAAGS